MAVTFKNDEGIQNNDEGGQRPAMPSRAKSVILTPEKKLTALMLKILIFIDGVTHNGVLTAIFLVAIAGYTPLEAFTARLVGLVVRIVTQPFIGDVVDKVKIHKYTILIIAAILKIISGVCMIVTTNFGVMCLKFGLDGLVEASFLSAVTALTLGVLGKARFHKKSAAQNNVLKFSGQAVGTAFFGFASYAAWPNVSKMYWAVVAGGLLQLVCIFFMTRDGDEADHRIARGRSSRRVLQQRLSQIGFIQNLGDIDIDSDDEEDDDKQGLTEKRAESTRQLQIDNAEAAEQQNGGNGLLYTQVMTYRQMYADPKRRRSLICLSLVLFTYYVANAPTAPLLGQYLATGEGQLGMPIATGLVLTNELAKVFTTWALANDRASKLGYRKCLIFGSLALCFRLAIITILVNYFANGWALGATQILDGIGKGFLDLMLMLYSHLLSRRTGHFNLNMGIVNTWKNLGSIVGQLIGGAVATMDSYEVAFPILCAISVLPILFSFGVSMPHIKSLD